MGGISSLFGLLALLGFALFIGGIALAIVAASQGRPVRGGTFLALIGLIVGLLFSVISQGLVIVEPTQVAVTINTLTGTVEAPKRGGTHVIVPIVQRVAVFYPITQQEYTMSATEAEGAQRGDDSVVARTSDGQTVNMDITIIFRLIPDEADQLYRGWSENYLSGFVRPTTRSLAREVVSQYTAEDIYGEARVQLGDDMEAVISERFAEEHLELTDLLVRDIDFSDEFTNAIEAKVVAEQQVEQAEREAERRRTEAAGLRDAAIARAEGEARATILQAQAEAEALRLVSEQVAANPALIQYLYVQNLSDNVSLALVPSNTPFLFDINSLLQQAIPNFSAPAVPQVSTPEVSPEATPEPES
jgi:regulator of protease activity HflC (stomatin/prohibitin superfamily)